MTTDHGDDIVVARGVRKSFGQVEVLRGIDFTLPRGSVASIIGPSGSGKSTFLRCINHLERIDGGDLLVDGEAVGYRRVGNKLYELRGKEIAARRAQIGMVFQHFNLFPHKTALGNIIEAPVQLRRLPKGEATRVGMKLLERVGLADKWSHYPSELSGGQQQRVAIARALAMRPGLILFDEPTSALDPELVGEVLDVIGELAADGMSMIVVTHELSFARRVSQHVAVMVDGAIVDQGPTERVFTQPAHPRAEWFLSKVLDRH